ncbi:NAD(P)/FAD-dependent oxidoreductase [Gluconacetobacter tumulisoli]|uniref:NAD(P)/FAD-dependent oxidoreductase n=1 Tax=Gluconacetobacter tumulisoli TaxID=1286189 RepID=A0A7W4K9E9_9PROT|nr:NAD(P)/FAD-dependent oxidoreductase [Gluconacetobacter tumulisoli]
MTPLFDLAVIGSGVVGCAVFRESVLAGLDTLMIERAPDLLAGASKANSAILHTGFDSKPGSLEQRLIRAGHREYLAIHERLGLPLLKTGATLVAWNDQDLAQLDGIDAAARQNGVSLHRLDAEGVRRREPSLAPTACGGLVVDEESLIDPWSAPLAYAQQAVVNGGVFLRNSPVASGTYEDGAWTLRLEDRGEGEKTVRARVVVNCAGLQGDIVEAIARSSPFTIKPRKGQFIVYDKSAYGLISSVILPVPSPVTKGIVATRTVFGNLLVGPTAEPQDDRDVAALGRPQLESLKAAGERLLPSLARHDITATYAGLRPATEFSDYQIEALPDRGWITVGGIRSTGLSSALGIARHVRGLYEESFGRCRPLADPLWPRVPNLTEEFPRPGFQPDRDDIICHCESVTRAEIRAALSDSPLPAGCIGGLRRRTRCMMGRCQGFYCTRRVVELAAPYLPELATLGPGGAA